MVFSKLVKSSDVVLKGGTQKADRAYSKRYEVSV